MKISSILLFSIFCLLSPSLYAQTMAVGSKVFTESYILGEIIAKIAEEAGESQVDRKLGLGQSGTLFEAMKRGDIDIYPEYSDTISLTLLKDATADTIPKIQARLREISLAVSSSLGFNNTYALGVRRGYAETHPLREISDLIGFSEIRAGFNHDFMQREDTYPALKKAYGLNLKNIRTLSHALAYEAIEREEIDLMELYSTDAKIKKLDLQILEDDRGVFPRYEALLFMREDFQERFPKTWKALESKMIGSIDSGKMIQLNASVDLGGKSFQEAAGEFLGKKVGGKRSSLLQILRRTYEHFFLVSVSLIAALILGFPLGVLSSKKKGLGQTVLATSGVIQTIPSLALLSFLIAPFGIGTFPAIIALFLYSLLPIVRGVHTGLTSVDPKLIEVGRAMGFSRMEVLRHIELPLAAKSILSGIKISVVINIGTATLAALIGAGGYGVPIVTGLSLHDYGMIMQGAVPAAAMALAAHFLFELSDRIFVSAGLR